MVLPLWKYFQTASPSLFSANRNGINIGEAAAFFVMTRDADFDGEMQLLG